MPPASMLSRQGFGRALRHRLAPSSHAAFPDALLARAAALVAEGETRHRGQVVLAIEARLPIRAAWAGQTPRQRARQVFAELGVWDTSANAGVLVYLLLADRAIEIVADRGLDGLVSPARWSEVCRLMEHDLAHDRHEQALLDGLARVAALIVETLPRELPGQETLPPAPPDHPGHHDTVPDGDPAIWNELPDQPHRLG